MFYPGAGGRSQAISGEPPTLLGALALYRQTAQSTLISSNNILEMHLKSTENKWIGREFGFGLIGHGSVPLYE